MPDSSTRAGASSGSRCRPRSRICRSDGDAAPGVGQVRRRVLVVGEAGARDGGHGGGDALVVHHELGGWEAVLTGPLVLVAQPQGLSEQGPLGRESAGLPGAPPAGRLLGMPAIPTGTHQSAEQDGGQHGGAGQEGE